MSDPKILPKVTQDEIDPREDSTAPGSDEARRLAEIAADRPPHHG